MHVTTRSGKLPLSLSQKTFKKFQKWIKKDKPRIKCPMENCRERVHENDIAAVLNPDCEALDPFMDSRTRRKLAERHDVSVIKYALGERSRCCPRCEVREKF